MPREEQHTAPLRLPRAEDVSRDPGLAGGADVSREPGLASRADVELLLRLRRRHVVPVDQPLVLISQVQRSGGTLLARLFDGHPQCHVHPSELHIGSPVRFQWPRLDLDEPPRVWFAKLSEKPLAQMFEHGVRSNPVKYKGRERRKSLVYPFLLPPSLQRSLFMDLVAQRKQIGSEREILECYLTSLFNAWLDNQNLYGDDKRWVVAFAPRLAYRPGHERFFETYPDGRLITIIRDPHSWLTSARGREKPGAQSSVERLVQRWRRSAVEIIEAKALHKDRVYVVGFRELVSDAAATMREIGDYLDIEFTPGSTRPTFNGYPVGANSSFPVFGRGVISEPVTRHRTVLTGVERKQIDSECGELYAQVLELRDSRGTPEHS